MDEYCLLYRAYGLLDAKSIQILLESFGIQSETIQESAGVAYGFNIGKLGSANIYVRKSNFDEAEKIICLLESGQLELPNADIDEEASIDSEEHLDQEDLLED
jgi:hypothetical protein